MDITIGDEPILDRGYQFSHVQPSVNEIEDHRSQRAMFTGVHVPPNDICEPSGAHRRRRRKSKPNERREYPTDPSQHVMFLLGEDEDEETHNLFCEMSELRLDDDVTEWKETARWIKFEEDVEEGGERWSKPHVASLSLLSLFELRNCLSSSVILLNVEAQNFEVLTEIIINSLVSEKKISFDQRDKVQDMLLKKHSHLHDRKHKVISKNSQLPLIRSLADIGKKYSSKDVDKDTLNCQPGLIKSSSSICMDGAKGEVESAENAQLHVSSSTQKFDLHFLKKIPIGAETSNILIGETEFLSHDVAIFVRLKEAVVLGDITEVPVPTRFVFILLSPPGLATKQHEIGRSMSTLMSDDIFHDVAYKARNMEDLLAGIDEFLTNCTVLPPAEWDPSIRIEPPKSAPAVRKVPSMSNGAQGLLSPSGDGKGNGPNDSSNAGTPGFNNRKLSPVVIEESHSDPTLVRTGRLFGGLMNDLKRRGPFYLSDFTDGLHLQCFASFFFLYFACLTPIITFGGLLMQATGGHLGAIESLLSGTVVGVVYTLFSGQPLTIMGSTGPVLVFESIVFNMCDHLKWDYLPFRLWIGVWIAAYLFLMVAFDLSALVRYITRFTEESFAALIALIFVVEAFKKLAKIATDFPVDNHWEIDVFKNRSCACTPMNITDMEKFFKDSSFPSKVYLPPLHNGTFNLSTADNVLSNIDWNKLSSYYFTMDSHKYQKICKIWSGKWVGEGCNNYYIPDVFFFSCLIFIGTFVISYGLKLMRNGRFFPNWVRSLISDFAVMIAITLMTVTDLLVGFNTPKLSVPEKFEPTLGYAVRGWIIHPFGRNQWWTAVVAMGPAMLAVILVFMDQQITAVIVNRKENKLKKGAGYHLDLLIVAILILVNSVLGIPWFVAATVLSINHILSLKKESENTAPGERPIFLGCREQRVTGTMIFLVIGLSVFLTPVLKRIPMAVLYGVFLFMGVSSLKGVQLIQRISLFFIPQKYQPDYIFLRNVPLRKVHLFTVIQMGLLALLWVIKTIKILSIGFPIMVLALCFVRKALEFIFTHHELKWLDDIMPDHKKHVEKGAGDNKDDESELIAVVEAKNEEAGINISEEMGKTAIWKYLTGGPTTAHSKKKKAHKREQRSSGHTNKEIEIFEEMTMLPLLSEEHEQSHGAAPDIVVHPPSARDSPDLKV